MVFNAKYNINLEFGICSCTNYTITQRMTLLAFCHSRVAGFSSFTAFRLLFIFQCADDQDAVCTRSVTLSLPSLEDMTVKLKHGGIVSVNSMNIQTPMHNGMLL